MSNEKKHCKKYVVASCAPFAASLFNAMTDARKEEWTLITRREDLTLQYIKELKPRSVFFPHWSYLVPEDIISQFECVCFHCSDVPYGRGGSPVQNLIIRGHRESVLTALVMTKDLDAGPVYIKRAVSLEGLAEEIYLRIARISYEMMFEILETDPKPQPQSGKSTVFKRRTPQQSEVPHDLSSLESLFDFIRMLDAQGYPRAFIVCGRYRFELSRPALRIDQIKADITITLNDEDEK